ncbi:MAG TPA: DUF6446 family protein [Thermohalobaculum sp.]|nr:DUF6446 family protein [Thermohalobaculum sp.]
MGIRRYRPAPKKKSRAGTMLTGEDFRFAGKTFGRREVFTTLLIVLVCAIAAIWWLYGRDFYTEIKSDTVLIAGNEYPVTEFRGIEAYNDPEKLRACFRIKGEIFAPPAANPQPRAAPGWFKCFYPERIIEELAEGKAKLYLAGYNDPPGYDRVVVVYDNPRDNNLRGFMWRQKNENYQE